MSPLLVRDLKVVKNSFVRTLARTRTRSHVWASDQVGPRPSSGVGECLVVRHVPGVAVDRCASFGVVRAGSVLLPGLLECCRLSIGGSVMIALHVFVVVCAPTR
eukprot:scaffold725_cov117-Isochrysis_galbana.AAC.1